MKKVTKESIDITFTSDISDEFFIELREKKGEPYSFIDFATKDKSIEVCIGKGNDAIIMDLKDLEDLIIESKKRLKQAKEDWEKTMENNPEWGA